MCSRLTGDLSGEGDVLRGGVRLGLLLAGDALLIVIEQKKRMLSTTDRQKKFQYSLMSKPVSATPLVIIRTVAATSALASATTRTSTCRRQTVHNHRTIML